MHRRLAAIMFTDIWGYTALMSQDELGALALLGKSRHIQKTAVSDHGGEWIKEMGDGVLAKFDSALDAVRAAMQIQDNATELEAMIRIGIHLGDVTIDGGDIFGNGVNIASRIESAADPGGIYISSSVFNAIRSVQDIRTVPVGDLELKNVPDPVRTYAIQAPYLPEPDVISPPPSESKGPASLAVLPFKNLGSDSGQQYVADGMQDALIGQLAQIDSLRVISRTSTLGYRDTTKSIPQIAKELGVDHLVEATVIQAAEQAHIQVQLIKAFPEEGHLWAGTYCEDFSNVFALYNSVVMDVTSNMKAKLTASELAALDVAKPVDESAYKNYLKGMFHWEQLTSESMDAALAYFNAAVELDRSLAPAYAGIAGVWMGQMIMGYLSPEEAIPEIYAAIRNTRKLDENNADCHFWQATLAAWTDWDWPRAQRSFERAIAFNTNHALARAYFSHLLMFIGKESQAIHQIRKAVELDPFNLLIQGLYAMHLMYMQDYRDAEQVCLDILRKDNTHLIALSTLRSVYHLLGECDKAYEAFRRSYITRGDNEALSALDSGYETGDYTGALRATAKLFETRSVGTSRFYWRIATLYQRAGERELALEYLAKAFKARDPNIPYLSVDPIFDDLRTSPKFNSMVGIMGLGVRTREA